MRTTVSEIVLLSLLSDSAVADDVAGGNDGAIDLGERSWRRVLLTATATPEPWFDGGLLLLGLRVLEARDRDGAVGEDPEGVLDAGVDRDACALDRRPPPRRSVVAESETAFP